MFCCCWMHCICVNVFVWRWIIDINPHHYHLSSKFLVFFVLLKRVQWIEHVALKSPVHVYIFIWSKKCSLFYYTISKIVKVSQSVREKTRNCWKVFWKIGVHLLLLNALKTYFSGFGKNENCSHTHTNYIFVFRNSIHW